MDPQTPEQAVSMIQMYVDLAWPVVTGLAMALVILVIGWIASSWAHRFARNWAEKSSLDTALGRFLAAIARYTILAAAVIAALGKVGVETTSLAVVFGSAGLAIGMALSGSLANFAAGVMILFFRPFSLGDRVSAGGETGVITDIGLFATTMLTPDNVVIIVPNAAITGGNITNYARKGTLRASIAVGVGYGSNITEIQALLVAAAKSCDNVLAEPAPAAPFVGMGASSLDFSVLAWSTAADFLAMQNDVRTAVYDALNDAGVDIPYDQVVVHRADLAEAVAAK